MKKSEGDRETERLVKQLTSDPLLVVHDTKTPEDEKAIALVWEAFGPSAKIQRRTDDNVNGEVIPSLFVSTSVCRGLKGIQMFISYIHRLQGHSQPSAAVNETA